MTEARIRSVAEGFWTVEDDLFLAARALHFPLRMSVLARPDGGLLLISPVAIDDALAAELAALGEVHDILAPNAFHHLHALAASERYPQAQLYLSPALVEKRPDLAARGRVLEKTPEDWAPSLSALPVGGAPAVGEVAVLHAPSRTLIVTDLVFHLHQTRGWMMGLVLRMLGVHGQLAQSRIMRKQIRDPNAARESYARLLACDFDRLVMAHGEVVEQGGRNALAGAFAWLLDEPQGEAAQGA